MLPRCGVYAKVWGARSPLELEGEGLMSSPAEKLSERDMASVRAEGDEDKMGQDRQEVAGESRGLGRGMWLFGL